MGPDAEEPTSEPTRAQVDATTGPILLEFGTAWCGHCRNLAPRVEALLAEYPAVVHLKVEDGPGRPLGRSFGVKLWPTLVFLRDGAALAQHARPGIAEVRAGLEAIAGPGAGSPS